MGENNAESAFYIKSDCEWKPIGPLKTGEPISTSGLFAEMEAGVAASQCSFGKGGAEMKRMTYRLYDQNGNQTEYVAYDAQFMLEHANEIGGIGIFPESKREELALRRLAEFEDAGMDPGEFAKLLNDFASAIAADTALSMTCGPDRAHEIMAAEAEKRLLVLPCKVGDPVWVVDRGEILEEKVLNFCTFMKSNGTVMTVMTTTYRDYLTRPNVANIGKLVPNMLSFFLTREEAERALAKERDS